MFSTAHNFISVYAETALSAFQRRPNLTSRRAISYLLMAVFLTFAVPLLQAFTEQRSGIAKPFLVLPFLGISSGVAFYLFTQERIKASILSLSMCALGIFLAGISLMFFAKGGVAYRGSVTSISAVASILNQSVIIPFYEELTVRTFLFFGVAKYLGFVFSAIAVSLLFGLAHGQISVLAFFTSILLCYLAYRNVGVFDRAIFHGSYNFVLIISIMVLGIR